MSGGTAWTRWLARKAKSGTATQVGTCLTAVAQRHRLVHVSQQWTPTSSVKQCVGHAVALLSELVAVVAVPGVPVVGVAHAAADQRDQLRKGRLEQLQPPLALPPVILQSSTTQSACQKSPPALCLDTSWCHTSQSSG